MFVAVKSAGAISNLADLGLRHRVALFADDMVIFAKPGARELAAIREVLGCFGDASGLRANPNKSSRRRSSVQTRSYMGWLPHSRALSDPSRALTWACHSPLRKPRKADLQAVLDKRTCRNNPWAGLDPRVSDPAVGLFNASVVIRVGDVSSILFWEDAWIDGLTATAIAPEVVKLIKAGARRSRTVQQGRVANSWALDISRQLSVDTVVQYLRLWTTVHRMPLAMLGLSEGDSFRWKWSGDGSFSSRGAYRVLFHGTVGLPAAKLVWDSFAPLKHKMHTWLALHRRCWTADRRLRRGLPSHSLCPLCATADETLDHLSLHCSYAQVLWAGLVTTLHLPNIVPVTNIGINDWWLQATARFYNVGRRAANSLVMLALRSLWIERNARVFEGKLTLVAATLSVLLDEWRAWIVDRDRGGLKGD
ncbi:hypothetical protein ACQ4PT_035948 [Festuca glaucescens]